MDQESFIIFMLLVFGSVFLLTQSIIVPTFGTGRMESRRLKKRLGAIASEFQPANQMSLVREKYLKKLSPFEKKLESLPGMSGLETFIERSGRAFPAYRLVALSILLGAAGGLLAWVFTHQPLAAVAIALMLGWAPALKLKIDLAKRFNKFEEQLPDALDIMTRALRAGYPFNETLQLVATEMDAPIGMEFKYAFDEVNFGVEMRWALKNLVDRMPSLSLMAIVTTVLVQKETGGNLAETFENISRLIRGRFRFQRRVRTLTAEARMSSWILVGAPFVMFGAMSIVAPDYIAPLIYDPLGHKLVMAGLALVFAGSLWIRKIISIEI
jgi:tight adherence protein B